MKKLISCALILSMLSSTSAICFADGETTFTLDQSYRDEQGNDILGGFGDELFVIEDEESEQADDLEGEDESNSSAFTGKLLTAWNCVTDFFKRHSSFFVIAGINTAITAFEYVVGTETANAIKNLITGCYNLFSLSKKDPIKEAESALQKAKDDYKTALAELERVTDALNEATKKKELEKDKAEIEALKKEIAALELEYLKVDRVKQKASVSVTAAEKALTAEKTAKDSKYGSNKKQLSDEEEQIRNVVNQNKELYRTSCAWFDKKIRELKTAIAEGDLQAAICHAESAIEAVSSASSATAAVKDCALAVAALASILNQSVSVYFIKAVSDTANIADAAALAALTAIRKVYDILTSKSLNKSKLDGALSALDIKTKDFRDAADIWVKSTVQSSTSKTKTYSFLK